MRKVSAAAAMEWFKKGWQIFMADPVAWVLISLLFLLITIVLMVVPLLGSLVYYLIAPALMAGMLRAAQDSLEGRQVRVEQLFSVLLEPTARQPMLMLGAILVAANFLVSLLGLGAIGMVGGHMGGMAGVGLFGGLLALIVSVLIGAAFFFAPADVLFRNTPPVEAIKRSFSAVIGNIWAMTVFGVIYFLLSIIASIPLGLGWLVLVPVLMGALYMAYQEIYAGAE